MLAGILSEIERRADAPKLYILTDFFEEDTAEEGGDDASESHSQGQAPAVVPEAQQAAAPPLSSSKGDGVRRWVQALRVYHNTDLWAPAGFDNDSNFERNEVWVSMECVLLPIDNGTRLRRRTIDFSTASPPCHNYVCHSMIKPHSRGSTLHGLEEWSVTTGLFTKSKDWNAIRSKWSDSALVLHSHDSHNEVRKVAGVGHEVKPQPTKRTWVPAAERHRRKQQGQRQQQPQQAQQQQAQQAQQAQPQQQAQQAQPPPQQQPDGPRCVREWLTDLDSW